MSFLLDKGTLDALVIGTDAPDDVDAWKALIRHPGGAEAYQQAVALRRRRDLVAHALLGRPWLARSVSRLSALSRRAKSGPTGALSLLFPDAELDALVEATLGPAAQQAASDVVTPYWGQVVPVRVHVGERITLEPPPGSHSMVVHYLCHGSEGALPTRTWKLEAGEAPVFLVALLGTTNEGSLDDAMGDAVAMAGVILLDESSSPGAVAG